MSGILALIDNLRERQRLRKAAREQAEQLVDIIIDTHYCLLKLDDLCPSETLNKALGGLVSLCCQRRDSRVIAEVFQSAELKSILPSLRSLCSEAEYLLECHWGDYIAGGHDADDTLSRLREFPYFVNYEKLARLELCSLASCLDSTPKNIAYIGSGPLPLTSLCLLDYLRKGCLPTDLWGGDKVADNIQVVNIDRDERAIMTSQTLSTKLGDRGQGMKFSQADAESSQDMTQFDVIYFAALVGSSQAEKETILISITKRMRPGAMMVIRSAWGLRKCLYPTLDLGAPKLMPLLEVCAEVHPHGTVLNSVILARVKSRDGNVVNT